MPHLVVPKEVFRRIIRRRRAWGADHKDEVWNGIYVMSPDPDNEHQSLVYLLCKTIESLLDESAGLRVFPGINVSDQEENWTKNYRCPDVALFLPGNPAEDRGTYWFGGPDFAVEIVSAGDRSRAKLDFYAAVGVRELLLVDRKPWKLELYRLQEGVLRSVGVAEPGTAGSVVASEVLSATFGLTSAKPRPQIEARRTADGRSWTI
jgi:Uma2 family endonuclease